MCFSHGHFYKAGSLGKRHTAEQRLPRRTPPQLEAVRGMDQRGWVLIAFHNAFRHLATGTPIEDALIETVSKGGDTDTKRCNLRSAAWCCAGPGGYPRALVHGSAGLSPAR